MDLYTTLKIIHILAFISWMAGMLYLPRLFVYHAEALAKEGAGSEPSETLKVMERKLLRYIMNPAMIVTWVAGLWLAMEIGAFQQGWFHAKMLLVILMSGCHGMMAGMMKKFARDANTKSGKFYRIFNEAPTLLMVLIVILVVAKPF